MGKKGVRQALTWDRKDYTLVATPDCYFFSFPSPPVLSSESVKLQDGSLMTPGDLIIEAYGKYTAACFQQLKMLDGYAIRYVGSATGEKSETGYRMLCFERIKDGQLLPMCSLSGTGVTYVGYLEMPNGSWGFCNPVASSRIVETSKILRG